MALSLAQNTVASDTHRFRVVCAGRRFGKTFLAIRELCYHARIPDQDVLYVAPTFGQAKHIVWRQLKNRLQDVNWIKKVNETELTITLRNNSRIYLKGADAYDRLRGGQYNFIVIDEMADIVPEAWYETLRPTLSNTLGKALFIGTPKGLNHFYDLYQMSTVDKDHWSAYSFTTLEGGNVPEDEITQARRDLDSKTFKQEYEASFETFAGRIYYGFERALNVQEPAVLNTATIYVGADFNVSPMCATIAVREGNDLYVIDEIKMYSSNTNELSDEIKTRYPRSKVWIYPDPAGSARKSSANGITDHIILANAGFVVKAPRSHTPVRDRINAVNSRLCDSTGIRHLFVSPKCKYTIECLERQVYKEGTSQPDKESGYDHMNDALGYMVDYIWPVTRDRQEYRGPQRWTHQIAT
jgi:hypothetical protein